MADDKKPVNSLLSSLEEIKKQTADPVEQPGDPAAEPEPADVETGSAAGDLLGGLLSEVRREADEEKARLDQTLATREEEKRRREQEEEQQKRAKYQKLVQEESGRRQAQLRQKEERAKQVALEEERRIKAAAEKVARAKAMAVLEKKRKRQRLVNLAVAAVVVVAAGVALSITRPWERTEPLKGIEEIETERYVTRKAEFKPLYDAADRGDPSFVEPRPDLVVNLERIPPIEALAWLLQGEMQSVRPDHRLPRARILLADTDSFRLHLEKRFSSMKWMGRSYSYRPSGGSTSSGGREPRTNEFEIDTSAFEYNKDKKKKKR